MLKLLLGDPNTRKLKRYQPIVEEINFLEEQICKLNDDELREETHNLKSIISSELEDNDFIRFDPINPAPPRINTFFFIKNVSF